MLNLRKRRALTSQGDVSSSCQTDAHIQDTSLDGESEGRNYAMDDKFSAHTSLHESTSSSSSLREDYPASDQLSRTRSGKLTRSRRVKGTKRRNAWIFTLGGIFGIAIAVFFAGNQDMIDFKNLTDLNLDSLLEVLPAGFLRDAQNFQKQERASASYDSFSVGIQAKSQGIKAVHPVIMIPGVISTGLESWGTNESSLPYFRKRMWGSWSMMRALVLDKSEWKRHIMLDKNTGLDPPNVKLRAAQGFDATDFFITGYWIWNKILENLACIGYDPSNAYTAAYDWRLSFENLEARDQYFTRLKTSIELANKTSGKKVVLLSHSMGSQVLYYFLHWVESLGPGHGKGGPQWVNTYVDSWINISGCLLGAVKGFPAILSGEMKDTAQLNAFALYGLEKFLSRHERAEIFRAMPGISSMLPIGGNLIWGNLTQAPDDLPNTNRTFGKFIAFRGGGDGSKEDFQKNLTIDAALPYLFDRLKNEPWYERAVKSSYSNGVAKSRAEVDKNQLIPSKWINPLETRLPHAPDLKIYCFYGFGKPTERAYIYRDDPDPASSSNVSIDASHSHPLENIDHGVVMGEGDGTVSLLSMGYMCSKGWKMKRYNPSGIKVTTFEMKHEPNRFSARGGPKTADHVDILGRESLNEMILRVVGGKGYTINQTFHSDILRYSDKIEIFDD